MRVYLPIALAILSIAGPAFAQRMSIGTNEARSCYESARDGSHSSAAVATCTTALGMVLNAPFDRVATLVNRGILHMHRGETALAMADYDAALAERPNHPEAMLNKGLLLLKFENEHARARDLFDRALAAGTSKPELAYLGRGAAHEQAGDVRAAYNDYREALRLQPDWQLAKRELSRFQVRRTGAL